MVLLCKEGFFIVTPFVYTGFGCIPSLKTGIRNYGYPCLTSTRIRREEEKSQQIQNVNGLKMKKMREINFKKILEGPKESRKGRERGKKTYKLSHFFSTGIIFLL